MVRTQRIPDTPCPMPRWSIKSSGSGLWSQNHQQFLGWWWIILGYAGGDGVASGGFLVCGFFGRKLLLVEGFQSFKGGLVLGKVLKLSRFIALCVKIGASKKSGWPWILRHPAGWSTCFLGEQNSAEKGGHWTCATCGGHVYRSCRERGRWVDAVCHRRGVAWVEIWGNPPKMIEVSRKTDVDFKHGFIFIIFGRFS